MATWRARWAEIRPLLEAALDQPAALRAAWIESAVPPDLREAVTQMAARAQAPTPGAAAAPLRYGPYRVISLLGAGGMGVVYLGERDDGAFARKAAIKVARHRHETESGERFQRERAILARLEHPAIARLYDAGLDAAGTPWFAMEYVEGELLNAYVARTQPDLPARVALVRQLAEAVAYAHANLIVHRDLKPGNVIVDRDGQPKLLDFGVAKLLGDTGDGQTRSRAPLTFAYAAPEQIRGTPVTTATDVYALGVILYELLVGERPHKARGDDDLALLQAITDTDAPAPSQAVGRNGHTHSVRATQLRGDLDTIVLKALQRDPVRRYASAQQLADDLGCWLGQRPIAARPDSATYVLGKWLRRNRALAASLTVLAATVVAAGVVVVHERNTALDHAATAEATKRFVLQAFTGADTWQGGAARSARDVALEGLAAVPTNLAEHPRARIEMYDTIGYALARNRSLVEAARARELQVGELLALPDASPRERFDAELQLTYSYWWATRLPEADHQRVRLDRLYGDVMTDLDRLALANYDAQLARWRGDHIAIARGHADIERRLAALDRAGVAVPNRAAIYMHMALDRMSAALQQRRDADAIAAVDALLVAAARDDADKALRMGNFASFAIGGWSELDPDGVPAALYARAERWNLAQFGDATDFWLQVQLGRVTGLMHRGRFDEASRLLDAAIAAYRPDDTDRMLRRTIEHRRGLLALEAGRLADARAAFAASLELSVATDAAGTISPYTRAARAGLAMLDCIAGPGHCDALQAVADEQAAADDGDWWRSALWLADAAEAAGERDAATAQLRSVADWHVARGARPTAGLAVRLRAAGIGLAPAAAPDWRAATTQAEAVFALAEAEQARRLRARPERPQLQPPR